MNVKNFILFLCCIFFLLECKKREGQSAPPKLVITITIDGLRADLLDRYDSAFTGGFRRLRDQGFRYSNAWTDHAVTVSHAGHVSIATGNYPSHHGIVDAAFYSMIDGEKKLVDAIQDTTESIVGVLDSPGYSPRKILATGLTDWISNADSDARTLAVGSGNISSLLYSYQKSNDVYWYWNGHYVTSTYYRDDYPDWVNQFNSKELPLVKNRIAKWENSVPNKFRQLARKDKAKYEGDHKHTVFPHLFENELINTIQKDSIRAKNIWLSWTPYLDLVTLDLAKKGIESMGLGQRNTTDCLSIVLSMVDSNSHYYGPYSMEVFDTLMRIDKKLGDFFAYLDDVIGKDQYLIALTADHGFPVMPEYSKKGRRIEAGEIERALEKTRNILADQSLSDSEQQKEIIKLKDHYKFIADIYSADELESSAKSKDKYLQLYKNSYCTDRVPRLPFFSLENFESSLAKAGFMVRLEKNMLIHLGNLTHGSVYDYDRKIPLVFLGKGMRKGVSSKEVRSIDIAPSLAHMADIKYPSSVDGNNLFDDEFLSH